MGGGADIPELVLDAFGYMYLADAGRVCRPIAGEPSLQASLGAGTKLMSADEIKADYPFYHVDDILLGSHNLVDEGYLKGGTMFEWVAPHVPQGRG